MILTFFLIVVVEWGFLVHQQPVGCVEGCFLVSRFVLGAVLVVDATQAVTVGGSLVYKVLFRS